MLGPGGTMSGMYFDDARGLRQACVKSQLVFATLSQELPPTGSADTHRKRNRKWKLLQTYLPHLGWGLLSLVTIVLAYREHRLSTVGQSLQTTMQELKVLKTQRTQLQVCWLPYCVMSVTHHVCAGASPVYCWNCSTSQVFSNNTIWYLSL